MQRVLRRALILEVNNVRWGLVALAAVQIAGGGTFLVLDVLNWGPNSSWGVASMHAAFLVGGTYHVSRLLKQA